MTPGKLENLADSLEGSLHFDTATRRLYATDASVYRELPAAVAVPKNTTDLKKLIWFANKEKTSLIPRTAGTSLAGQVVGEGIVVDVSRHFTSIIELNEEEHWVRVEPGVIRDELNRFLFPHQLQFGPETSTSNRAMIGGMVGNNSCGSNSVIYGTTRDHLLEVEALLSDGTEVTFKALSKEEFEKKCYAENELEAAIYQNVKKVLSNIHNQIEIKKEFPAPDVTRRNTGYALDKLADMEPFNAEGETFNFCKFIAGSEGTLAFITEVKLNLLPTPPAEEGLLCVHFDTVDEALRANVIAMQHHPSASELMDNNVLDCTKGLIEYKDKRFFIQGEPGAILVVGFLDDIVEGVKEKATALEEELKKEGLGYHFPLVLGADVNKVWTIRKDGLGLLGNIKGDVKAVGVIEDTSVSVKDLPAFIRDFNVILDQHEMSCVHYAHAGSGELHLRPMINLKTSEGNKRYRAIAEEIATLVKKYKGSLSGEHGDGRLRGEFIRQMIGDHNYELLRQIKRTWDPNHIFNPGKIVDTPPMDTQLRYEPDAVPPEVETIFDFGEVSMLQHAEQCNGTGLCIRTEKTGGTMCPSFMATRDEKDSTRARANIVREVLTHSTKKNKFDSEEIYGVMDNCLACKGCKRECPSGVDVAKMKMEFLQHYYDANGTPLRSKMIANIGKLSGLASHTPGLYNFFVTNKITSGLFKRLTGFAEGRSLPKLHKTTVDKWMKKHRPERKREVIKKVYFFNDEFTNFNDTPIGIKAIKLLEALGYEVVIPEHGESGRAYMSKGLLRDAKKIIEKNVKQLKDIVSKKTPLIGLEPSAILSFRDEYPEIVDQSLQEDARKLGRNALLFGEFIAAEMSAGNIKPEQFTEEKRKIKLQGHCHQKALTSIGITQKILSLPKNYEVRVIPSGCCGMAGSFGFEKEHFDLSMQVGELVVFPAIRKMPKEDIIAAPGTSCRHQILDGVQRKALHPAEVLYDALIQR